MRRWICIVALLSAAACTVDPLASAGRPCSDQTPCGPGTTCDPVSRTCVSEPVSDGQAGEPDLGEPVDLAPDVSVPDGAPDIAGPDAPPACSSSADCTDPAQPVCDNGSCRPCRQHAECPDGLCTLAGACPPASAIAYVDAGCAASPGEGTKAKPYCDIDSAMGQPAKHVLVRAGSYAALTIDKSHELYAEPGAVIKAAGCDELRVKGGTVLLTGFLIEGNVHVEGASTSASLVANTIGPSACVGVDTSWNASVFLRRNLIWKHTEGGIRMQDTTAFAVENNFIVLNGTSDSSVGGALLKPKGPHLFINNTVAENIYKGGSTKEGAIRCENGPVQVTNTIIWGNQQLSGSPQPIGIECQASHCDADGPGQLPGPNNLSVPPQFVGGPTPSAAAYHLQASSALKDKGTATDAPAHDYDGDPRSDGQPDIGADEIVP